MKFDDCIYKEITWFNADEIVEHETFDGIDSYELLRNLATLGLLRIISIIIGIVAWCRVVRRCRLCALSLPIFSTVMTAGVLMACFMRP